MVSYEYQELFYKQHQTKDFLIVDANATITPVTGEAPTVSGATIEIHTADIESESFQLDESICSEDNLKFGLCESAKVEFTIKNKADIPNLKSSDYGDLLNIYLYFNGDSDTLFQIGQYVCYKDEYTSNRKLRNIELYDLNFTLNDLDITSWYNQYFSDGDRHQIIFAIADLFNWINKSGSYANDDSSPNIQIEIDPVYTLCNGAFPIGKTIESDTITFGFFMQGLLEFNGAFGHITREGKFKFLVMESYDKEPCRTVTDDFRKPPTNYSDDNTWGIGQIDVYGRNNEMKFTQQNTDKKKPSIYVMVDPWVIADRDAGDSYTNNAIRTLLITINHYNYNKSETECSGDLCIEVGDRYNVEFTQASQYDTRNWFRSYVLERHFKGIQSMHDTYLAKGDKKQPLYQITNDNWHIGDSSTATQGQGTGGVSELNDEHDRRLIEIMRNYGQPMLDEPTVELTYNRGDSQVEIKWTDPADITSYSPLPVEWAGTIVVRKEGSQPIHRWGTEHSAFGGTVLVDSTTRDEYSVTAYADDTIEPNKRYYYAIMPYFVALDDEYHPVKHYRWTKVYSVDTTRILVAPTIYPIQDSQISGTTVTVAYTIPTLTEGSYTLKKLVVKKNSIPTSKTDGDKIIDLNPDPSLLINGVTVTELDEFSQYYFVIFIEDEIGSEASSEPRDCATSETEGYRFEYTGDIQTFTAPETGTYSLETWGAQGQSDGDARGGYGAYSKGEVWLTEGQTLYIGVGGQNGYNGGGNFSNGGDIVNIGVPDAGQAIIFNDDCWTQDYGTNPRVTTMDAFTLADDVLDVAMTAASDTPVTVWERNGVKLNVMKDSHTATYGGEYRYSFTLYDGNDLIVGDPRTSYTYANLFYVFGFDRRETTYNSNVQSRLQKINVALGVDHDTQQGYISICVKSHCGYQGGVYVNYDYYYSIYGDVNSHNINRAKLYDALVKASQ